MRLAPVWVAIVTASTTLSLSNPVSGQTVAAVRSPIGDSGLEAQGNTGRETQKPAENAKAVGNKNPSIPQLDLRKEATGTKTTAGEATTAKNSSFLSLSPTPIQPIIGEWATVASLALPLQTAENPASTSPDSGGEISHKLNFSGSDILNQEPAQNRQTSVVSLETISQTPPPSPPNLNTPPAPPRTPTPSVPVPAPGPGVSPSDRCPDPAAPQVLVAEVAVTGVEGALKDQVYQAIRTQPGRPTNRCQLQEDINAIFATGLFSTVDYQPEDTPLGVRVTFVVQQNPILRSVSINAVPAGETKQVVPQSVIDEIFGEQYGTILNLRRFQEGIKKLNQWYKDKGYILAQVVNISPVDTNGRVTLQVAEGIVEDIQIRFLNKEGEAKDEEGNPIKGRTRPFIITREMAVKPGAVLNEPSLIEDLRRIYGLGIFEKVEPSLNPGTDPRKVVLVLNVTERNSGSVAAGAGISSSTGVFGTLSYQQQNLGGNNQKLGAQLQVGERALLFDVNFTDPWIAGDPYRTSYTVNGFRRRSISLIFSGGPDSVYLPNGDRPRVVRTGGGVTFTRPLSQNPLETAEWTAYLGLQYQRVEIRDTDGRISPRDELGNLLSLSDNGKDDLTTLQFGVVRDLRDNPLKPTKGSVFRLSTEQSIPLGQGNIFLNRLRGSYSQYFPANYFGFVKGPQTLAVNIQAGTVLGDLPPYEAFALGGSNSVRGYDEGDLGSGQSFIQATAEYRFPLFSFLNGALFVDVGSDLGTGSSVPGNPAGVRGKPGSGFGYGLGVRIDSPLGPIRIDYGLNDQGGSRLHFGIGERF